MQEMQGMRIRSSRLARAGLMLCVLGAAMAGAGERAATTRPAPTSREARRMALRRTPMVAIFEACKDSVVTVTMTRTEVKPATRPSTKPSKPVRLTHTQRGSGFVLHEAGFLLTNSHALRLNGRGKATFHDGKGYPFRVIATDPGRDLALLKIDAKRPLKPLPLGRSGDLMVGEPAVTLGNPFGMGLTMASGIVSALGRSTKTEYTTLTDMIQTDAGINPGCSGGPVLNVFGEVIGVVTSQKRDGEGLGFATPIDKVRAVLGEMIAAEGRYAFVLGMQVATGGPAAVTAVAEGSPAQAAGVRAGDVVAAVGGRPVRRGIDFHLALVDRKGGEALGLTLSRSGKAVETTVTLGTVALREAVRVAGLVGGVNCTAYTGRWRKLPDFRGLKPAETYHAARFELGKHKDTEHFALEFTGYVRVPTDGVYLFATKSDDGSRLYVGGKLVVDNDGLHAAFEKRGFAALKAGTHPIRVTFFEAGGDDALEVFWEGPGLRRQVIPAKALSRRAQPATQPKPRKTKRPKR